MSVVYAKPKVRYDAPMKKSKTIPDQSLSIKEIVDRYVRGIPVDITEKKPVYVDQNDHDLEKLSRMDFGEKAEYAAALRDEAATLKAELDEQQAKFTEAQASSAKQKAEADEEQLKAAVERALKGPKA